MELRSSLTRSLLTHPSITTLTSMVYVPTFVGVPLRVPVDASNERPAGSSPSVIEYSAS